MATRTELAHLLRRATFGPRADDVDAAERAGLDATVTALFTPAGEDAGAARTPVPALEPVAVPGPKADAAARQKAREQQRQQVTTVTLWWLDRMVQADHQLREKLTFYWHGHWATSVEKVRDAHLMLTQQQTLYRYGAGDFGVLVKAMLRDPALIVWLDGQKNTVRAPNENLARELMELFTLGIGRYGEADVRQAARALTGWRIDQPQRTAVFDPKRHDGGQKTILGATGAFDADGLADVLLAQAANAEFLAARLWSRYASGDPVPADAGNRLVTAYRAGRDVGALLRAVLADPAFGSTRGQLVKQPVEWAVGAMRQLGIRPGALPAAQQRQLLQGLDQLGQVPFKPPSVGGWPAGTAWLSTSAVQVRLRVADLLAGHADPGVAGRLTAVPVAQRSDALARLLVVDAFTERTRTVLAPAAGDVRRLIALGLASPEYTVM
ncbi:DUF1800 domain-containing protein [Planosporangium mesophilum]|uniref:DUF1800 domain-containing protein n=1 Tax=Planosporangium mesophilum TaxID=689768 RepID=A0A8J3TB69_9ACTN|nr:DUF1800 domain-containing protein [Planosporangium mesophilum]NJC84625.1 DUF1800 domain-containing protein [Planosporangium mesophilum]GII23935.1 hypothetical protein Pme01_35320 [Planosporangium mesophilum]